MNATRAAVTAGFSARTAYAAGSRILNLVETQAELKRRTATYTAKVALTAEETIRSIARAMRFDYRKLLGPDGKFLPAHEWDEDTAMELEGVEFEHVGRGKRAKVKVKLRGPSKATARDQAMKHFGLYRDRGTGIPPEGGTEVLPVAVSIDFKDARRREPPAS